MFLLFKNFSSNNLDKSEKIIEANFLIIRNYSIITELANLEKDLEELDPKLSKKITSINIEIKNLLINNELLFYESSGKLNYNNLWNLDYNIKENPRIKNLNSSLIGLYEEAIQKFLPNWKVNHKNYKSNKKLSKKEIKKLFSIILQDYQAARYVLIDILTRTEGHYSFAIADIRDAVDHISKGMIENQCNAIIEFSFAAEHIRRAAMESIQTYLNSRMVDIESMIISKMKGNELQKNIKLYFDVKKIFCCARYNKANETWYEAVYYFYQILRKLEGRSNEL